MKTLADRFRRWYEHERDCNAKILQMLRSVPEDRRAGPEYQKAVQRASHLIDAREIWLARLGRFDAAPPTWNEPTTTLEHLPARFARVEAAWVDFLKTLDDDALA